ncbi:MAG TPA: O-antigen ligase family protein [Blastocatellia bacterium]
MTESQMLPAALPSSEGWILPSFDIEARRHRRLLIGASLLVLFFVTQEIQLFTFLAGLQVVKLTGIAVAVLFLSSRKELLDRVRLRDAPQVTMIIGLLLLGVVTIPFAVWPAVSFQYALGVYAKNVVFVYLLLQIVRSDKDARTIVAVLSAGSAILVVPMLTHFGPWVTYKADPTRMAVGATYDANDLALLFVVTIPFSYFALRGSRPFVKLMLLGSIALMLAGMVKTGSRGGFVALVAIGIFIFLASSGQARKYTLIAVVSGVALFAMAAPASYWERMDSIYHYENDYNLKEVGGRIMIWETGLTMIAQNPIIGVGIGCFPNEHAKLSSIHLQQAAHNAFIQVTSELGVGGFVLFSGIIIVSLRMAYRARKDARLGRTDPDLLWLASAVQVSFIGYLAGAFFLSHAYSGIFSFCVASGAIVTARYKAHRRQLPAPEEIEYA